MTGSVRDLRILCPACDSDDILIADLTEPEMSTFEAELICKDCGATEKI